MPNRFISPLLFLIASATQDQLAKQIQYLKAENEVLRARLPRHIRTTPTERVKLLKFGKPLGASIKDVISIVTPRTFARWVAAESGRPRIRSFHPRRTPEQIRALVVRIARDTGWGYTRILGELRKLRIFSISHSTIKNILIEHGIEPAPTRAAMTWDLFLKRHADTFWACDFFTKSVWTPFGLRKYWVLMFIHIGSRQVHIAGITDSPNRDWMAQRAHELAKFFRDQPALPRMVLRDRDPRFTPEFDAILARAGVPMLKLTPGSPNLNAYAERWIQSIKHECLNHFIVFGQRHLRYLIDEYVDYYHTHRPHQGIGNKTINRLRLVEDPAQDDDSKQIICRT